MESTRCCKIIFVCVSLLIFSGCSSSGSGIIDKLLGGASSTPILTSIPNQVVAQDDVLNVDVNNIMNGLPGNDEGMSYKCTFDTVVDKDVTAGQDCTSIPDSTVSFDAIKGSLLWTPHSSVLGNFEVKITGKNGEGTYDQIFTVGVRLKFNGLGQYSQITGTSVTVNWTPNPSAQGYQIFRLNQMTGQYELFKAVSDGASSGTNITGLSPNTPYTLRVQAMDALGNLDGNVVSRSFTTTELVKIGMSTPSATVAAGTSAVITLQAYNANDSLQTVGGLPITASIASGTSSGTFSPIVDNDNGTYTFSFTPTTVGTPVEIEVSTNITFYLKNKITLTVLPGPADSTNSSLSISSGTVVSGNAVTLTANIRDSYNNPINSGAAITFNKIGGTSSGTLSAVTNLGNGSYSATYTGITAGTSQVITVSVGGVALTPTTAIQVVPGAPVSSKSSLTISSSSVASGSSALITATLRDLNNNPVPSGILVSFNKSGGTSTGSFDSVVNVGSGVYTTNYSGATAGTAQTITVASNGVSLTPSVTVAVVPGPASLANSNFSISGSTVISGSFVTATATLRDSNNNPIESGVTVTFSKTGGTSTGTFGAVTNQGNGVYIVRYTGVKSGTAQDISVLLGGTVFGSPLNITVLNGSPSAARSSLTISSSSVTSGQQVTITATVKDDNDNLINSGVAITLAKTGGTSTGDFSVVTNAGSGVYTATYTGLSAGTAQTVRLLVDGSALGPSVSITVNVGAPSSIHSTLLASANPIISGQTSTITATIKDLNSNPISTGIAVTFTKTGGTATGTFGAVTNQGNGVYTIVYTGIQAGTAQNIKVFTDGNDLLLNAPVAVNVGAPSITNSTLAISSSSVASGSSVNLTATIRDINNNPVTSGVAIGFSKTGGSSTGNLDTVTNAGGGVYTTTYTGLNAGSAQTINILVDGFNLGPTASITVIPGAPSNLQSTLTISANTVIAGQYVTLTATIKDANNNPISSGALINFDKIGGTSFGNYGSVVNQGSGVYTVTYTGITAGTAQTVQANVNGTGFGPVQNIQVLVGAPSLANSSLTLSSNSIKSAASATITAVVRDSQNNPITNQYVITVEAHGGSSSGTLSAVSNAGNGSFTATYAGINAGSAQTIRVLADGSPISGLTASITVTPGNPSAANSEFTIGSSTIQAGTSSNFSIVLRDSNDNAIISGAVITFNKAAGVSNGNITAVNNEGSGNYSASYTATTMGAAQTIALVVNGASVGLSVSVTVTAGPPTHFAVVSPAGIITSIDCNGPYTLTLKDTNENTTTSTGEVNISLASNPIDNHVGTIFTDSSCSNSVSSLSIPAFVTNTSFYYKSYTPQNFTLGLAADSGIATTNIVITNSPVLAWMGAAAYFSMNGSGSNTVGDNSSGGLITPNDVVVSGNYLYATDFFANRIVKYDVSNNTLVGWIGHVGSTEGMTAYDGSTSCNNLSVATSDLTPVWCRSGRSSTETNVTVMNAPKNIISDGTYLYVSSGHRILRFLQSDGSYQGWFGKIATVTGLTPASCVSAGVNATTPTWCFGGTHGTGTADGQFNGVKGLAISGNYLYAADTANHRIQRINISNSSAPFADGWVGMANVQPGSSGQLSTCATQPATNVNTPGWCLGGTSKASNRLQNAVAGPSPGPEVAAPKEGFYSPEAVTTDGTYLYVGDTSNYRVVRMDLTSGAFTGWIGQIYRSSALSPTTPAQSSGTYTSTWTQGGVLWASSSSAGFGSIVGIQVDTSTTPNYLYITDSYARLVRVKSSDGSEFRWIGRATASPTGGYTGCSSTPVGGSTPGWCIGGSANRSGNSNSSFYTVAGLTISNSKIYVADQSNFRIQRFNKNEGSFDGWIGTGNIPASKWSRTIHPSAITSRLGIDDYSMGDTVSFNGVSVNSEFMFETDVNYHRIKKFNKADGSMIGYVGQISVFPPTGPEACVGYTSGMTPAWCTGGGRTTSGGGILGFNNPYSLTSDNSYVYIGNYNNHRIDRVRISDGLYLGWIGKVGTVPTDGDPSCLNLNAGSMTENWCIGGTAGSGTVTGSFNAPRALYSDTDAGLLYSVDNSARLIRIRTSDGATTGAIGHVTATAGCTVGGVAAQGWCTTATGGGGSNVYGGINTGTGLGGNNNYLFVSDTSNHRLMRFNKATGAPAGVIAKMSNGTNLNTTVSGGACAGVVFTPAKPTPGWCYANSVGAALTSAAGSEENAFNSPRGVTADNNYVYVSDTLNHRIVKIDAETGAFIGWRGLITSTAGMTDPSCIAAGVGGVTPKWCTGGTSGPGKKLGAFDYPTGLSNDSFYVYVIDGRNNRTVTVPK